MCLEGPWYPGLTVPDTRTLSIIYNSERKYKQNGRQFIDMSIYLNVWWQSQSRLLSYRAHVEHIAVGAGRTHLGGVA